MEYSSLKFPEFTFSIGHSGKNVDYDELEKFFRFRYRYLKRIDGRWIFSTGKNFRYTIPASRELSSALDWVMRNFPDNLFFIKGGIR